MNEQEPRSLVERMVLELTDQPNAAAPARTVPAPAAAMAGGCSNDITETDLRRQYLVKDPKNDLVSPDLKLCTPARLGLGRAGARYRTIPMLRTRADHVVAQDSVFSYVNDAFVEKDGLIPVQTSCQSKDEYLTRPDRGHRFDKADRTIIKKILGQDPEVVLTVGDGLSSVAIETNAVDCIRTAQAGLKTYGPESDSVLSIKYCRAGASDHTREPTGAEAVCLPVGEWSGLATAESMSAYLTYEPRIGIPKSERTVIFDIHHQDTTAVEAGTHTMESIRTMLERKASSIDLR